MNTGAPVWKKTSMHRQMAEQPCRGQLPIHGGQRVAVLPRQHRNHTWDSPGLLGHYLPWPPDLVCWVAVRRNRFAAFDKAHPIRRACRPVMQPFRRRFGSDLDHLEAFSVIYHGIVSTFNPQGTGYIHLRNGVCIKMVYPWSHSSTVSMKNGSAWRVAQTLGKGVLEHIISTQTPENIGCLNSSLLVHFCRSLSLMVGNRWWTLRGMI